MSSMQREHILWRDRMRAPAHERMGMSCLSLASLVHMSSRHCPRWHVEHAATEVMHELRLQVHVLLRFSARGK